jgi:hypothetical protein
MFTRSNVRRAVRSLFDLSSSIKNVRAILGLLLLYFGVPAFVGILYSSENAFGIAWFSYWVGLLVGAIVAFNSENKHHTPTDF